MELGTDQQNLYALLERNTRLLEENNRLLKKIHRNGVMSFWVRLLWYFILIGVPFLVYFYVLHPYLSALGSSYQNFSGSVQEIPGWKEMTNFINTINAIKSQH